MRYIIRQKVFSLGDRFAVKNEMGDDLFIVQSQFLSVGKKLRIYDLAGNELCYIEQQLFRFMPEYNVYLAGQLVANIKKKFAFFKHDFEITSNQGYYNVEGDFFAHEFNLIKDGGVAARISKAFFSFTDTYGVDVDDDYDQITTLALAIVIDMACHDHDH